MPLPVYQKPYWNTAQNDPWASAKAAAAGAAAGSNASSAAATIQGNNAQSNQAGAMSYASGIGDNSASSMSPDDIQRAIAKSKAAGSNASSAAAGIQGNANAAGAGASYGNTTNMASLNYGAPVPQPPAPPSAPVAPPYNPADTNIPYATWDNIQPYFNPMYQMMLDSGTNAIQNSAAAHNMLHSSGTIQDIGDWATKSMGQAYDSAVQNFMTDRSGVYGIGKDVRDFNYADYQYQNGLGLDAYKTNKDDYQKSLSDYYAMLSGLSGVGQTAAGNAAKTTTDSATAMANLFMAMAQMKSMGGMAQANNQSGMMGSIMSILPLLMAA